MLRPTAKAKMGRSYLVRSLGLVWRLKRLTRKGYVEVVDRVRENSRYRVSSRLGILAWRLMEMKKPDPKSKGVAKLAADDPLAFKDLENLRGFFLDQVYEDGVSERVGGTMIVKAANQRWLWTLKDDTACVMLKLESQTWDEGVLLLEELLGDPDAPWEHDPYAAARRKPRKRGG